MLEEIVSSILYLYFRAAFIKVDLEAMLRHDWDKLAEWNRGLARVMLWLGGILVLPLTLGLLVFFGAYLAGVDYLFGVEVELGLALAIPALALSHLASVALLIGLCVTRVEWEPLGFVLALADMLGTTPAVLQNIWRAMVCLPLGALIVLLIVG